jgi:hypothetical protein
MAFQRLSAELGRAFSLVRPESQQAHICLGIISDGYIHFKYLNLNYVGPAQPRCFRACPAHDVQFNGCRCHSFHPPARTVRRFAHWALHVRIRFFKASSESSKRAS